MHQFDAALYAFALFNTLRLLAYVPQVTAIWHDQNGAAGVSCLSWLLFALSHFATAIYALTEALDLAMSAFFLANTTACVAIVLLTQAKRRAYIRSTRLREQPSAH